ncbi:HTTM domain-containing protein [Formosa sp. A9]|uniref:HTTM domain-containing protein n=1 Tax=Formosa sp. A9 TaxID=3442641 RepID=UPI003EB7AEDB
MGTTWTKYINSTVNPAPLAGFRLSFGLVVFVSLMVFWSKGNINTYWLLPKVHFPFYGLDWFVPASWIVYTLFSICSLSAFGIMIGYKYRWAIVLFLLSFTYLSLMEMTVYSDTYYLISVISFLMLFLPANAAFSVDSLWSRRSYKTIPKWCVDSLKLLVAIVFVFKGLGTLNTDWLLHGQPVNIWLSANTYSVAWIQTIVLSSGLALGLSWLITLWCFLLPVLLLYSRFRYLSFILLLGFYWCFLVLFPVQLFPFILVISTLIFFSSAWHHAIIRIVRQLLSPIQYGLKLPTALKMTKHYEFQIELPKVVLGLFFLVQLVWPLRYLSYSGEWYWTEKGLSCAWRSELIDKTGRTVFTVSELEGESVFEVDNSQFLAPFQEEQVSVHPNLMLQYAQYLGDYFANQGHKHVQVFVFSKVSVNGRPFLQFSNPKIDVYREQKSLLHEEWILPFPNTIKGL